MMEEEVNRCQIQNWYPKFKSLSIRTIIHELPESFIEYLNDPGPLILPVSVTEDDAFPNRINKPEDEDDYQIREGSEDESEQLSPPPSFPELELKVNESIQSLGGAVFPKLNWSAPKDSAWISSTGTLKCSSFSEIVLLLRSSDSLIHDLNHAYDTCSGNKTAARPPKFVLALRKWYGSLRPEMEFRCFVLDGTLIGVSQREVTGFYHALVERKDELNLMIWEFYKYKLRDKFESESYTFDVYVTEDGRVKLLDFNPWGGSTLPLLFTWEELKETLQEKEVPEFRIIESQCGVRPGMKTAVPYDYLDTSPGSGWDQFLNKANEELRQQTMSAEAGA